MATETTLAALITFSSGMVCNRDPCPVCGGLSELRVTLGTFLLPSRQHATRHVCRRPGKAVLQSALCGLWLLWKRNCFPSFRTETNVAFHKLPHDQLLTGQEFGLSIELLSDES